MESLKHAKPEELIIKDEFSNSLNKCLRELYTAEFVATTRTYLNHTLIERLKEVLDSDVCNLLLVNILINTGEYMSDPVIFSSGFSVFNLTHKQTYRNGCNETFGPLDQLKEMTSAFFISVSKSSEKELKILEELSNSINECLTQLFTREFIQRTRPEIPDIESLGLDAILSPVPYTMLRALSVSRIDYINYVPPVIYYEPLYSRLKYLKETTGKQK